MKALHTSIVIIIAAIVILIAALVILTLFGMGITSVGTLTDLQAQCSIQGVSSCQTTGSLPMTWNSQSFSLNNIMMSCKEATGCSSCQCILGTEVEVVKDYEPREKIYAGDSEGRGIGIELPEESIEISLEKIGGGS